VTLNVTLLNRPYKMAYASQVSLTLCDTAAVENHGKSGLLLSGRRFRAGTAPTVMMEHYLRILLYIALAAVLCVLITGVFIFARGGETNRRYSLFMMNMRVGVQAVVVLLLVAIYIVHRLAASSGN
jgi:cytochrome b subunit of formate dehydrogenase